jgi:two-component system, LuxR family, response regulator FixJ
MGPKADHKGVVYLVDDDNAVRRGISALLVAADYKAIIFASGEEFLGKLPELDLGDAILLVDICMPGIQGLELQERLLEDGVDLPIIVMTAHGDIPMAVRAMRNGAIDFLQKPFTTEEIITALDRAYAMPIPTPKLNLTPSPELYESYKRLTPREDEVLREMVSGSTNKEIARILAISPRTIEVHRHNIMTKMKAATFAELVRMTVNLGI